VVENYDGVEKESRSERVTVIVTTDMSDIEEVQRETTAGPSESEM
jgi:hypothetical protein